MDRNEKLGRTLKQLLAARGMKVSELARRAKIDNGQISRVLRGQPCLSIDSLRRVSDVLGVTPGTLLDGKVPEFDDEAKSNYSASILFRSFKKLSPEDRQQVQWIVERFTETEENRA